MAWEDLELVFATRGTAYRCQCRRNKLAPQESFGSLPVEERAFRLRQQAGFRKRERGARALEAYPITTIQVITEELHVGTVPTFEATGMTIVNRPSLRRVVMRIDY